jgi:hypothetical protein
LNAEEVDEVDQEKLNEEMEAKYGTRTERYDLRPRKKPQYNYFANSGVTEENLATPQMSMAQGIRMFGNDGIQAVKKELQQVHDRKVLKPRRRFELTSDQ